jgi:hypothetical protein
MAGFHEHGDISSVHKTREFLDQLNNHQQFKEEPVATS